MGVKGKRVLGVYREPLYSHNALEADRLILDDTLDGLAKLGIEVGVCEASHIPSEKFEIILSMAQGRQALSHLVRCEKEGGMVLNSTQSVLSCYRVAMSKQLSCAGVGYPASWVLKEFIDILPKGLEGNAFWIKRGDVHAVTDSDVVFVESRKKIPDAAKQFFKRSIQTVILQQHCEGQVFKFYGVKNGFFHCHLFNLKERQVFKVDVEKLHSMAHTAADALGLEVFGGDCVVGSGGKMHIIDMNDWPSFRKCRVEAATYIGQHVVSKLAPRRKNTVISSTFDTIARNVYQSRPNLDLYVSH